MTVTGRVIKGEGKAGAYYGVPTANLAIDQAPDVEPGVYAGLATIENGTTAPCVICYGAGPSPTSQKFEVHLIDWSGDLYGSTLSVDLKDWVSDLEPFSGEVAMKKKILDDVAKAAQIMH